MPSQPPLYRARMANEAFDEFFRDQVRGSRMPILFSCSSCSAKFRVPDPMAGKKVRCPKCQSVEQVPSNEPEINYQVKAAEEEEDFWSQSAGGLSSGIEETSQSSSSTGSRKIRRSGAPPLKRVWIPGMVLLGLAFTRVLLEAAGVIILIMLAQNGVELEINVGRLTVQLFIEACFAYATITGLLNFVRLDEISWAWTGLILAMFPCGTSLLCFIAIPFSIWGIVLMSDKSVSSSFHS